MSTSIVRFAIGDPGGLSSNSWRVWVAPDGDTYVACRDNYQELKVSLHGDRWRVGLTTEGAEKTSHLRARDADRAWIVWNRPAPVGNVVRAFRLVFLPSELAVTADLREPSYWRDTQFISPPRPGSIVEATIVFVGPGTTLDIESDTSLPHFTMARPGGDTVHVTFQEEVPGAQLQVAVVGLPIDTMTPAHLGHGLSTVGF